MDDVDEDMTGSENILPINQTILLSQDYVPEDTNDVNDTIKQNHTLNKRLDPSIDPDNGQLFEDENTLNNLGSIDYPSDISNHSILDHMQIINNLLKQHSREGKNNGNLPRVKIHNIISGLPKPEIEMLYAVYQGMSLMIFV